MECFECSGSGNGTGIGVEEPAATFYLGAEGGYGDQGDE